MLLPRKYRSLRKCCLIILSMLLTIPTYQTMELKNLDFKLSFFGRPGAGKDALLKHYVGDKYQEPQNGQPAVYTKEVKEKDHCVDLIIHSFPEIQNVEDDALFSMSYRGTKIAFFCYGQKEDEEELAYMKSWMKHIFDFDYTKEEPLKVVLCKPSNSSPKPTTECDIDKSLIEFLRKDDRCILINKDNPYSISLDKKSPDMGNMMNRIVGHLVETWECDYNKRQELLDENNGTPFSSVLSSPKQLNKQKHGADTFNLPPNLSGSPISLSKQPIQLFSVSSPTTKSSLSNVPLLSPSSSRYKKKHTSFQPSSSATPSMASDKTAATTSSTKVPIKKIFIGLAIATVATITLSIVIAQSSSSSSKKKKPMYDYNENW